MATIRTDLPYDVRNVEHTWIELPDGARLSARLRLPVTDRPVPAILEYLPYRKDDGTLARDERQHDYLAGFGFACVRVDLRGSGDSDGVLHGEYL
jgi:predicted acyl esterase